MTKKTNSFKFISFLALSSVVFFVFLFPHESYGENDRKVWSSKEIGVRFNYDTKWIEVTPTQDSTVVAINWLSKDSKGLIATCYLGAYDSAIGKINVENIHNQSEIIAEAVKNNSSKRSDNYKRLTLEKRFADNYPVIYLVQSAEIKSFEGVYKPNIYSIITSWNKKGIMFSCASDIPARYPQYKETIEEQIMKVLRTLQFDRK